MDSEQSPAFTPRTLPVDPKAPVSSEHNWSLYFQCGYKGAFDSLATGVGMSLWFSSECEATPTQGVCERHNSSCVRRVVFLGVRGGIMHGDGDREPFPADKARTSGDMSRGRVISHLPSDADSTWAR